MTDIEKPTSVKTVLITVKKGFHFEAALSLSAVGELQILQSAVDLGEDRITIPPQSVSRPLQLQVWYGLADEPGDGEDIEIYLAAIDVANLPDVSSIRQTAEWMAAQRWIQAGVPANTVQTLSKDGMIFLSQPTANLSLVQRIRDFAWVFLGTSTTNTDSTIKLLATLTVQHTILQRTWRSDSYKWSDENQDVWF